MEKKFEKALPWGINRLSSMISNNVYTEINGLIVRSVPCAYNKSWFENIRAAVWVLTGRAEAVIWPEPGELEKALKKGE